MNERLQRLQTTLLLLAALALVVSAIGFFSSPDVFFRSWLMAWLLWLGPALGCVAFATLHTLTGGRWGEATRFLMEAAGRTMPVLAILFVPVLFGLSNLYPWTHPDLVAGDAVLRHKQIWLNIPFFLARTVVYFAVWTALAFSVASRQKPLAAAGLVIYAFTLTFAVTDWAQSLQPHWFSSVWGFLFIAGQGLSAMSLVICALLLLDPPRLDPNVLHDLGKLMFAFVLLWAYLSFSQLLIIWGGNLTEEIPWYMSRLGTNWAGVGLGLLLLQFLFPFLLLLSRTLKRHRKSLLAIALLIFVMRAVDMFWMIVPGESSEGVALHWLYLVTPVAVGAAWLSAFVFQLRRSEAVLHG
ncbi:MAG: hypothetical protein H7039_00455 [Bryobacteraceae bacterium]|nr:hypothetical protein [Bryobacteraceae bacterium]